MASKKQPAGPPRDRPKPRPRPTGPTPEDFAALAKVIRVLGPLESHDAKRVLYAAAMFFGMLSTEELVLDNPNLLGTDDRPPPSVRPE